MEHRQGEKLRTSANYARGKYSKGSIEITPFGTNDETSVIRSITKSKDEETRREIYNGQFDPLYLIQSLPDGGLAVIASLLTRSTSRHYRLARNQEPAVSLVYRCFIFAP